MTAHASIQSQVTAVGCYIVVFGGVICYGIRCSIRERRQAREEFLAHRLRVMRYEARLRAREQRPLASVPARIPPRRLPSFETCEAIWAETLALWDVKPDTALLDEWERAR